MSRGAGFVSCQVPELVFGLGDAERARVEVRWPGGEVESFGELERGARALLVEGTGAATAIAAIPGAFADPLPKGFAVEEGDVLPKLLLYDRDGRQALVDIPKAAKGKRVLLNFWASYCAPCVKELPLLQERADSGDVAVIAISVDVPADFPAARAILDAHDIRFPTYFGIFDIVFELEEGVTILQRLVDLKRLSIPSTLGLSPDGRVETILRGPLKPEAR